MPLIPAYCPKCRITFTPNAIFLGEGSSLVLGGGTTNCPKCGGRAQMASGTLSVVDGTLKAKNAPTWVNDVLERMRELADVAKGELPDNSSLLESVREVSPELADALTPISKIKPFWFLLLVVVWVLTRVNINLDIDVNDLVSKAIAAAEQSKDPQVDAQHELEANPLVDIKTPASERLGTQRPTKRQSRRTRGRTRTKPSRP